jgi:hypothetical protein
MSKVCQAQSAHPLQIRKEPHFQQIFDQSAENFTPIFCEVSAGRQDTLGRAMGVGIVRAEEICLLPLSNPKHRFFCCLDFSLPALFFTDAMHCELEERAQESLTLRAV